MADNVMCGKCNDTGTLNEWYTSGEVMADKWLCHNCDIWKQKAEVTGLNQCVKEAFDIAKSKGWHETPNNIPDVLMKMVCEISEAMEEYRNHKPEYYEENGKPEGVGIELVDCVIRIFDTFGEMGWDFEKLYRIKMEYNKTRTYKHGGKKC